MKAVLGAMFFLDERLGRADASDFSELWRNHLIAVRRADNIEWARQLPQFWHESSEKSVLGRKSAEELQLEIEQLCEGPLPDFVLNCVEDARTNFQELMKNVAENGY